MIIIRHHSLPQSQDSEQLQPFKNFKYYFQHDLLQEHTLGCKTENAPGVILAEKKSHLNHKFLLKYNVYVYAVIFYLLLNGTVLSGLLSRIMQQSYSSATF